MEKKIEERTPIDQWLALNQILNIHRTLNYVSGGVISILIIAILLMALQSPLAIVTKGSEKFYAQSERKVDVITEKDVENFVREFLVQMFNWKSLDTQTIIRQVSPIVTSGLVERVKQELTQKTERDFKGKNLSQDIANVKVEVTEKNVIATFDKVLRIEGVPLVIPTEIAFNIVRGSSTRWNPMGLYVNGLVEHEGR